MPAKYEAIRDKFIKEGVSTKEAKTRAAKIFIATTPGGAKQLAEHRKQKNRKRDRRHVTYY